MSQEFPYEEIASSELDDKAVVLAKAGTLRVSLVTDTRVPSLRVDGPCPRCDHHFSQTRALELPVSSIRGGHGAALSTDTWADFRCACSSVHPGAPSGGTGCGATYSLGCPPN